MRAGEKRHGWGAIVIGIAGGVLAVVFTQSGVGNLEQVFVWSALVAAMLRYATPLIFAALGGVVSERSGVVNVGLEGMMLVGAFFAAWGADITGSWIGGLIVGMAGGAAFGLIHAIFAVVLQRRPDRRRHGRSTSSPSASPATCSCGSTAPRARRTTCPRCPTCTCPIGWIPFVGDALEQTQPAGLARR